MSAETYTVEKVAANVRDVKLDHGEFKSYGFTCVGRDGVYSLLQKPDSKPPAAGDTFEATVKNTFTREDGTTVINLKKVQQQNGFKGGGGPRPRDPQERKSIQAQASQKVAVDIVRLGLSGLAADNQPASVDAIAEAVERVTERLFNQIERLSA